MELLNKESYPKVCFRILKDLEANLPGYVTYHRLEHTLDVANVCNHYIEHYLISDKIAPLIRIAAIGHDYGYLYGPKEHEERSIEALRPMLEPEYSPEQIELIAGMIRATKVPQEPKNLYEEILADADLDYLGRGDYATLSEWLHEEFVHFGVVSNERQWLEVQIKFLEKHHYHTDWALKHRAANKARVLDELRAQRALADKKAV